MTDLEWMGDRLEKDLFAAAGAILLQAAITLQGLHKKDLSKSNPPPLHINPSKRGEYPRGRTWNLRDSVAFEPMMLSSIVREQSVRVGYRKGAEYGVILGELMGRKWLENSLIENEARILQSLQGVGEARMV